MQAGTMSKSLCLMLEGGTRLGVRDTDLTGVLQKVSSRARPVSPSNKGFFANAIASLRGGEVHLPKLSST